MSRGYTNYSEFESYNDSSLNTNHAVTGYADHVCRPVVVDAEGRRNPIVRFTPANNSDGYVMKAERVLEHVSRAPVISILMTDYQYGSAEKEDVFKEYGAEKRYTQLGSAYDRPEKVENFLTKIQTEVSQPNRPTGPLTNSNWRGRPISTVQDGNGVIKYGDGKDFIKGNNQKKGYSVPIEDKQKEGYSPASQGTIPGITNNKQNFYERPNEGNIMPSRPLSRPTTDIKDAVEFLTEGIKPIQSEVNRPAKPGNFAPIRWRNGGSNFSAQGPKLDSGDDDIMSSRPLVRPTTDINEAVEFLPEGIIKTNQSEVNRPAKLGNFGPTRWGNGGFNFSAQGPKLDSGEEPKMYPRDNLDKYQPEAISQQPRFGVPAPKEVSPYAETIDSSEAKRRYSKLKPPPVSQGPYATIINSDDLITKYNGAKVPW